jgi:murein DD-endopeptidase MepM/ murein hydrolase activator NlpD
VLLVLAPLGLIIIPGAAYARKEGVRLNLVPEVKEKRNSQTMNLLEGFLNINPTGTGGGHIAIVDKTALAYDGESSGTLYDEGLGKGEISVYIVRKGDTLSSIAKMFDVSVNTITWANDIVGGKISIGQELVILPISGVKHTVKSGETLKSIALKYKGDLEEILNYNDMTLSTKLAVGDIVIIPDGEIRTVSSGGTVVKSPSGTVPVAVGYYLRPVNGVRSQGIHGRNGVDIAARIGTPIYASAEGKVIVAKNGGYNGGYGSYVVISHPNGTQTLYGHMSRVDVGVGQNLTKGQTIGAVGTTGKSTGPHVHFEVRGAKNPF